MATTSSNLVAGKGITVQSDNGKGKKGRIAGLVASTALGLSLLSGMVASQVGQRTAPTMSPLVPIAQTSSTDRQQFFAWNLDFPTGGAASFSPAASGDDWAISDGTRPGLLELGLGESALVGALDLEQQERRQIATGLVVWSGPCRPGGSDCLPDEEIVVPAPTTARPQIWTGTCRAGGSDCLPDEEVVIPAQPIASPRGWTGSCRPGGSDCLPDEDIPTAGQAQAGTSTGAIVCITASAAGVPGEGCATLASSSPGAEFVVTPFTYREDHRASSNPIVTSFLPGKSSLKYYV